ncbi:6448_t:CDS:2 [Scutellospora calospora]|uniref:6448_t:CDS:1 n=1 Tax=Scutellospora calospora TaxID=85575 RepID=A0ACA9JTT5_9GLOM|nr:6448_t:CDS:2 [Scutellospora calospora]
MKGIYTLSIVTTVALIVFLSVFFSIGYPEILKNNFTKTICDITRKWNIPNYCCYKECNTCENAPSNVSSCNSLLDNWNSIDPMICNNNCPSNDDSSLCKDGYRCCAESCYQTCSNSGSGSSSSSSCTTRCDCVSWVWNERCKIICPFCYKVIIEVKYNTSQGIKISNITNSFRQNKKDSENYMNMYSPTTPTLYYYDPKNISNAFFNIDYTIKTWAIVGITIFFLFVCLVSFTIYLSSKYIPPTQHCINIVICPWFGTVIPIILISVSHAPNVNTNVLYLISLIFIIICWANVPNVEWEKKIKNNHKSFLIVIGSFVIPLLIFEIYNEPPSKYPKEPPPAYTENSRPIYIENLEYITEESESSNTN